ncbi:zf-TFIIB domain-containing protein [methanotrophic endosymbiont of Bathymodiolus puteoserpentis (Logatchev)]|jgi:Zn-finger nucleic acid-binding protein|uniref:zf-TFIIB domain-containing protein n=1 Tax=methanotrophic endosymbiont of Bathymodiolus puteoserpentis (Logatchev) TaxID=343235 RepID=UPI0013CA99B4|nr:zf-TFIIB domain-containing protein [methanotrophic endosymbiont of Bathymodiolus puteoserpentis (Logatchev)]SHE19864.1 hypothetical protein BPUTEOMOX_2531 [methanotrophic endosymbiont of Bathymodiolus puteoserpentis (Logatchev)]
MARCKSCSAPLLANTNRCQYCAVRNDVDLHAKHDFSIYKQASDRICPHCEQTLQTIQLQLDDILFIERCADCFGLFFDLGELETLLNHAVNGVQSINLVHLDNINIDRYQKNRPVKYIKCPVCQEFMRRTNFAQKSGVIVDSCRAHGLWLDSGEVTHLMEWKKMGGQLLHDQKQRKKPLKRPLKSNRELDTFHSSITKEKIGLETDLLDMLAYVIKKIL